MSRNIILILTFGFLLNSCSLFNQNDFLSTEYIGQIGNEKFFYSVFQTGFDNYRIEFKVADNKNTTKIFDYYINDAVYTKERSFKFKVTQDTLIISTRFQSCKFFYKTKRGTRIELTNDSNPKLCNE